MKPHEIQAADFVPDVFQQGYSDRENGVEHNTYSPGSKEFKSYDFGVTICAEIQKELSK